MQSVEVTTRLDPAHASSVMQLIARAESASGFRPVSDQFWLDLTRTTDAFVRVLIHDADVIAYAQAAENGDGTWSVELVVEPTTSDQIDTLARIALRAITEAVRNRGGTSMSWLVFAPSVIHDQVADDFGLRPTRRLYQMTRSLPTGIAFEVVTRPFVPGADDEAWLGVNQRAFAWNPEQGDWSLQSLQARMAEPWFDPSGFLVHEREGRLAGFCWTKVHAQREPHIGEIYVIAVDPDFHGLGLGRALTLAGLDHLAGRGITHGMLFVDADNTSAVSLYDALGFSVKRVDCVYHGPIT